MQPLIIDTREKFEFKMGHVQGALNLPPGKFMGKYLPSELDDVAEDRPIIVYCRTGSRSNVVAHILKQAGFTNIVNGINQGHVEKMLAAS